MRIRPDSLARFVLIVLLGALVWIAARGNRVVVAGPSGREFASPDAALAARAHAALSATQGKIQLKGLHQPVDVLRDRWGVPHIYAQDQHDLFFAQGFVAAQDRLFQMELWKRLGQGRLAEIFGPKMVERDANARRLRYRGSLAEEYASYSPDTKEILEAFTEGITANIKISHLSRRAWAYPWNFSLQVFHPNLGSRKIAFCAWPGSP